MKKQLEIKAIHVTTPCDLLVLMALRDLTDESFNLDYGNVL